MSRLRRPLPVALLLAAACAGTTELTPPRAGGTGPSAPGAVPADTGSAGAAGYLSPALARRPFPADNPWNTDVSAMPVDPNSAALIAACGTRGLHADFGTVWNGAP